MEQIEVSVGCTVYNHERYLRKCLEGFVSQKTNFLFEVLVHDDASTDSSTSIIREYAEKYPDIIKPIYQTENQYSKGRSILKEFIVPIARGKYLAFCEGDDYWCDDSKLQRQFDAMENHPECHLCLHTVRGISADKEDIIKRFPPNRLSEGVIEQKKFYEIIGSHYSFQTSCYFRRTKDVREYYNNFPLFARVINVGDEPSLLYSGTLGKVYYIDSEMSCYRMLSIGSWSSSVMADNKKNLHNAEAMVRMYDEFNKYSNMEYQDELMGARRYHYLCTFLYRKDQPKYARVLCKKENRDFLEKFDTLSRSMIFLRAYCPGFSIVLSIMKKVIR